MSYDIEFKSEATTELEVSSTIQDRILDLIPQALSADLSGLFKLRIGDYRVIYSFDTERQLITIHKVGHRSDIYN